MYTKIINQSALIFTGFLCLVCSHPQSFLRTRNTNQQHFRMESTAADFLSECTLPTNKSGFCVQAQICNLRYSNMNETFIDEISCGPRNQDKKRPYVCCEPNNILDNNTPSMISETVSNNMSCGIHNQLSSRIVGGEDTEIGEFPWLARLMRINKRGDSAFSCTGALISHRVVITTGHCIASPSLSQLGQLKTVHLGEHETECKFGKNDCLRNRKILNVSKLIIHPLYKPESNNFHDDIGLIVLEGNVEFTNHISPICLLEEPYESYYFVVSGWGKTEHEAVSRTKLKTMLMPFSWQQCVDKYATINITLSQKQFCAGGVQNQDSCQGDSGGPLMVMKNEKQWYAAGLVSFGVKCGLEGWPGVYLNIPSYIQWIRNEMSKISI